MPLREFKLIEPEQPASDIRLLVCARCYFWAANMPDKDADVQWKHIGTLLLGRMDFSAERIQRALEWHFHAPNHWAGEFTYELYKGDELVNRGKYGTGCISLECILRCEEVQG